jgi:hypothetical protein
VFLETREAGGDADGNLGAYGVAGLSNGAPMPSRVRERGAARVVKRIVDAHVQPAGVSLHNTDPPQAARPCLDSAAAMAHQ